MIALCGLVAFALSDNVGHPDSMLDDLVCDSCCDSMSESE